MYNFYKDEPVLTQIHGPAIANPQEPDAANMLSHNYADPALAKIREAVRGNGLKAEMVSLTDIKGETAAFDAKVSMVLRTRTVEKIVGGKKTPAKKSTGPTAYAPPSIRNASGFWAARKRSAGLKNR